MQGKDIHIEMQDANNDSRTVLYLLLNLKRMLQLPPRVALTGDVVPLRDEKVTFSAMVPKSTLFFSD